MNKKGYFCLTCEGCQAWIECCHHHHPRVFIAKNETAMHSGTTNHRIYQPTESFFTYKKLKLENLAYNYVYGKIVREKFLENLLAGEVARVTLRRKLSCAKCEFKTKNSIVFFNHIKDNHL